MLREVIDGVSQADKNSTSSPPHKFDVFTDIPMMTPAVIEQHANHRAEGVELVATNRSRSTWVASMRRTPGKGGECLLVKFNISTGLNYQKHSFNYTRVDWGSAWDVHQKLLVQHRICTINLEASDDQKLNELCRSVARLFFNADDGQCQRIVLAATGGRAWLNENQHATRSDKAKENVDKPHHFYAGNFSQDTIWQNDPGTTKLNKIK